MALSSAAGRGHIALAERLIKLGAHINPSPDRGNPNDGEIPLCLAVRGAHIEMARLLLEMGAHANSSSVHCARPLQIAAQIDSLALCEITELVKLLLNAGADCYNVSLSMQEAAQMNDAELVKLLLAHGADVNIRPRQGTSDKTSLQHAATNGNFEIVKMLLEAGGDINAPRERVCGRSALEGAAEQGFLDMVRFLLEIGADVQGKDNQVYRRSVYRAWQEGNIVVADMIQDFKKARYGLDDCVSIEEIVDDMDLFELEFGTSWKG
ncbi:ankyrin repeat-containing domain protein [Phaeosphaeriaceae sp. PMI808]|nr:ankyrin repeat-containing domain protein [Phaeosphaeriaceae sp. PMI808]